MNTPSNRSLVVALILLIVLSPGGSAFGDTAAHEPQSVATAADTPFPAMLPLQGLDNPSLAYGLNEVVDYSSIMPFVNVVKSMRGWFAHLPGQWGGMEYPELQAGGYLDENGWLKSVPPGTTGVTGLFAWEDSGIAVPDGRAGRYLMQYRGSGDIRLDNVTVVSRSPGAIVFDVREYPGNWWFTIKDTNPADYIRDISIVREDQVDRFLAGAVFNPEWLALVQDARLVRFMQWTATNDAHQNSRDDLTPVDYYSWSPNAGQAVPIEIQVRLANEIGADPWFNIPHLADDGYVTAVASYVRDHLDPRLTAHVEFSNEAWNWQFRQTHELVAEGRRIWGNDQVGVYYVKRATEVMRIWTQTFGDAAPGRLLRVLGGQPINLWLTKVLLDGELWRELDPHNWTKVSDSFDAYALTSYFGGNLAGDAALRQKVLTLPRDRAFPLMRERLLDPSHNLSVPAIAAGLRKQQSLAAAHGLRLILYEGGQHHHHADGMTDDPAYNRFMIEFVRSREMADLYRALWYQWAAFGEGPFMQFVATGRPSKYGSWGLRFNQHDQPPRARQLDLLNARTPAWWGESGGSHYQQGRTVTGSAAADKLAGTAEEDVLLGLAGDDLIYPGPGDDRVNGGSGVDTLLLRGARSAYTVEAAGNRISVSGPDGNDLLFAIERLQFSDGAVLDP